MKLKKINEIRFKESFSTFKILDNNILLVFKTKIEKLDYITGISEIIYVSNSNISNVKIIKHKKIFFIIMENILYKVSNNLIKFLPINALDIPIFTNSGIFCVVSEEYINLLTDNRNFIYHENRGIPTAVKTFNDKIYVSYENGTIYQIIENTLHLNVKQFIFNFVVTNDALYILIKKYLLKVSTNIKLKTAIDEKVNDILLTNNNILILWNTKHIYAYDLNLKLIFNQSFDFKIISIDQKVFNCKTHLIIGFESGVIKEYKFFQ